ncbi:MAG: ketopantoate reductase family protein [Anaerolineales bacterium]
MRALVFGAGAIGTYIGGSLAAAGHTVTFLARPATAQALREQGLCLALKREKRIVKKIVREISVAASPAEALAAPHDFIVFALKSFDTASALAELRAAPRTPPPLLCLQNGVDNEASIAEAFGAERVIAGTVTTAVSKSSVGQILVERERGAGVALGHPLSAQIVEALKGAGLNIRAYPSAGPMKWSKLLANLVGNAASAILDMPVAELFADPRLFAVELAALRECLAVMRALNYPGVDLPGTPVRALAFALEHVPPPIARPLLRRGVSAGRGGKMPSFHIDLHSGRGQTEVRWLNGAVARHGAERGVPTPVNQILTETLEALSAGRLNKEDFRRRPEALLRFL